MNDKSNDCRQVTSKKGSANSRFSYASPKIIIYGDVTELTKGGGTKPPHDSETTNSGISP